MKKLMAILGSGVLFVGIIFFGNVQQSSADTTIKNHKKPFFRSHCKADPDYTCVIRSIPPITIGF